MTYASQETSVQDGAPAELYEFTLGADVYRYTSHDADVVRGGHTYTAAPIARPDIALTSEMERGTLNLTCSRTLPLLENFLYSPPEEVVLFTLYRQHAGDAESIVA
jgi:hypothetical protein